MAAPTEEKIEQKVEEKKVEQQEKVDILIYGATGFTGQFIAKYAASLVVDGATFTFGLAGRSRTKLEKLRADLCNIDLKMANLPIYVADCKDAEALLNAVSQGKVVINATGPFRFLGEYVVKACVEAKVDYCDISGEPQFIEGMAVKYYEEAEKNGSHIVMSCGFDSIPADMGAEMLTNYFKSKGAVCSHIESYLSMDGDGPTHATTFKAIVHGFNSVKDLRKVRVEAKGKEWKADSKDVPRVGEKLQLRKDSYFFAEKVKKYAMLFKGADSAVIRNSQQIRTALLRKQGVEPSPMPQMAIYATMASGWSVTKMMVGGALMGAMNSSDYTRGVMLNNVGFFTMGAFSEAGPTKEQCASQTFTHDLHAKGFSNPDEQKEPDIEVRAVVTGKDPGYGGTSLMCMSAALTLLEEKDKIIEGNPELNAPKIPGGVLTPSAAFANTSLQQRLEKQGITFKILQESR